MKKHKYKEDNSIIKSYTLEQAKEIVQDTYNKFYNGISTEIGDWEYNVLLNMINETEEFYPKYEDKYNDINKTYSYNTNIVWKEKNNFQLKPYFYSNGNYYSLKNYNYVISNNLSQYNIFITNRDKYKIDTISDKKLRILCPKCCSNKLIVIDKDIYCNNKECIGWYNYFYETLLKEIKDSTFKKYLVDNVKCIDFDILSNVFTKEFLNNITNDTIFLLYKIKIDLKLIGDTFLLKLEYLNKNLSNKYMDLVSRHLKSYLEKFI